MTEPSVPTMPRTRAEYILEKVGVLMDDMVDALTEAGIPKELAEVHVATKVREIAAAVDQRGGKP